MPTDPFKSAEQFIQLRDKCLPSTWMDQVQQINDMILMPLITLFLFFTGTVDVFVVLSSGMTMYRSWSEWNEYTELRFEMQRFRIRMAQVGGPFITTNNPKYMPYVWADAVVRHLP